MNTRTLIILLALGAVAIAGGWYFGIATLPSEQRSTDAGKLMFPDLAPRLQQATEVEVDTPGSSNWRSRSARSVARCAGAWPTAAAIRCSETKLRAMLTALTELRLVDQRTSDPTQFATLGVEDPSGPTSNSDLLRVLDASGRPIAALIVGHRRVRTGGNVPDEVYVRRPGDNQSWLAEGSLEVDADPQLWLDRDIMNIDHSRIVKVAVTRGGATLEFARADDKLALTAPADHPKLDDYKLQDVSRALELLTFDDVHPDDVHPDGVHPDDAHPDAAQPSGQIGTSVFSTSDGLIVTASVYTAPPKPTATLATDREVLARFTVTGDGKSKAEADHLQARLAGWTYEIGAWKQSSLVPSLDDLTTAPSAKPAPAGAPAGAKP